MKQLIKGETSCNRTACQTKLADGAIYYNSSTEANYCPYCAYLINKHNHNLCTIVKPKEFNKAEHDSVINVLREKIIAMHPEDGLTSPRDIELVHQINRLSIYIDEVENNIPNAKRSLATNIAHALDVKVTNDYIDSIDRTKYKVFN